MKKARISDFFRLYERSSLDLPESEGKARVLGLLQTWADEAIPLSWDHVAAKMSEAYTGKPEKLQTREEFAATALTLGAMIEKVRDRQNSLDTVGR